MLTRSPLILFAAVLLAISIARGGIILVDGTVIDGEVLFKHPNANLLVLRSSRNSCLQSFGTDIVSDATINGKKVYFSARRPLTPAEKSDIQVNALWADEASPQQIGRYAQEAWEKNPAIIWAHPGTSGDAMTADNWLDETGRPLTESPWKISGTKKRSSDPDAGSFNGDILLPAAVSPYDALQAGNRDYLGEFELRHLTIERNANYMVRYAITGNLWLKDGSEIGHNTQTGGLGSRRNNKNTVARFCGERRPDRKGKSDPEWMAISHWVYINTGEKGSLEIVGKSAGAGDRLTVEAGTLILSENSYLGNGPRASFYTKPGTTTILLNGARLGYLGQVQNDKIGTYGIAGTLMIGTPEHPITEDFRLEMARLESEYLSPDLAPNQRSSGASLVLGSTGKIVVNSVDPKRARVIFTARPSDAPVSQYALGPRTKRTKMPDGITLALYGETDFNGVVFESIYPGGVLVSEEARKKWKNVTFGKNLADGEAIFRSK